MRKKGRSFLKHWSMASPAFLLSCKSASLGQITSQLKASTTKQNIPKTKVGLLACLRVSYGAVTAEDSDLKLDDMKPSFGGISHK